MQVSCLGDCSPVHGRSTAEVACRWRPVKSDGRERPDDLPVVNPMVGARAVVAGWLTIATWRNLVGLIAVRDRNFASLRRSARAAIIMPTMFALGDKVIGNPAIATFAGFGSFALLLLVDFGGSRLDRMVATLSLGAAGCVLVALGTVASGHAATAALGMGLVAFLVLFSGVVSSVLAGASTALLLSFILPVTQPANSSAILDRLAGWAMSTVV